MRSRATALLAAAALAGALALWAWFLIHRHRGSEVEAFPPSWLAMIHQVDPAFTPGADTVEAGARLAQAHCGTCHQRPDPAVLPRFSWIEVLNHHIVVAAGRDVPDSAALSLPAEPLRGYRIPDAELARIMAYYLVTAPERLPPAEQRTYGEPAPFEAEYAEVFDSNRPAMYALAAAFPERGRIVLGEVVTQSLAVHDAAGAERHRIPVPGVPTGVFEKAGGMYVTLIGPQPYTTNDALGKLIRLPAAAFDAPARFAEVLSNLRRPVHTTAVNLDGDPEDELLVEEFGFSDGSLGYYDPATKGTFTYHKLIDASGTLSAHVGDFNHDGHLDVMALVAQATESVFTLWGRADGRFEQERSLQNHPAFGSNELLVTDLDHDGRDELVVISGDRMDLPSRPMGPYSGVHVYAVDAKGAYAETYFYPLIGAVQAVARDFDRDGDLDIVAVSATPDFDRQPFETAIYLENQGGKTFLPRRIPGAERGCWSVLDAADLDHDGDDDLVMGAAYVPMFAGELSKVFGTTPPLAMAIFKNHSPAR